MAISLKIRSFNMKTIFLSFVFLAVSICLPTALAVSPPGVVNHQGRIAINGVNHDGTAYFKFALVNGNGTATYWNSDNTQGAQQQPTASVEVDVVNGHYSVPLGDSKAPLSMPPIGASVFTDNVDVRLRIWVSTDNVAFTQLTPDRRLTSSGYALSAERAQSAATADSATVADGVAAGGVTSGMIAAGAVDGTHLASGSVGSTHLAAGSVKETQLASGAAAANLNASGQAGVAIGGMVLSTDADNAALAAAGYVKIGVLNGATTEESWAATSGTGAPAAREFHTAVWTGSEMVVWGGYDGGTTLNDGARYDPVSDSWMATSGTGAPAARAGHTAVWTGSEMIVWGGFGYDGGGLSYLNDGGRYDPVSDSWLATSGTGTPAARAGHTAVWTGSKMIVWGGDGGAVLNDGGRYDPVSDTWVVTSATGAPVARQRHTAVWTGSKMIVWGGSDGAVDLSDGGRYDPVSDSWVATSGTGAPGVRRDHTAVWTGSEMIVWGGIWGSGGSYLNDGRRYDPVSDSWVATSGTGEPTARVGHTAVWTGSEMIVWGGAGGSSMNEGARYDPVSDSWVATSGTGEPEKRYFHTAVWTGSEMIVWGGEGIISIMATGAKYRPREPLFLYQKP